jgi:hypothetical protein
MMICLGFSSSAWAQSATLRIGDDFSCSKAPGFQVLNIPLQAAGPVKSARFKIVASSPVTIFSPPNGEFDVTLDPCVQNGSIGQLVVVIPAGPSVTFTVVPATGDSEIELTDCDDYALRAVAECGLTQLIAPYRPNPPDGAVDVPINQLLSYVGAANYVVIGTDPDLENPQVVCQAGDFACALPLNPGTLSPHTTYYWQAVSYCLCGQVFTGYSDIFSFTTGDAPLAVEATTWGHVKALYRE